ncbi:YHYH domain [Durusdinium trenchii]|uniref:YHYH domain n=1 Tax=Durusdinium trenchii TaxID=1381693 RepID=A0ABP0K1U3_9DINO
MLLLAVHGRGPGGGAGAPAGGSCQNPSCSSPPCAAPLLGDVGCTTVSGTETYAHELLPAGSTINSGAHIFGPFEAGFSSQQDNIIQTWGCSTPSVVYDSEGGTDISIAEKKVAYACNIEFPRLEGGTYYGVVGPCGGHTNDYHFHRSLSCLYSQAGGHSTKVGETASHSLYGKWEDYDLQRLPLLDACGAHIGPTPESSTPVYHYHVQDQAPFTVGCHGPSQSGGLVSVALCRSLYSDCDDDGGSGTTITTKTGNVQYDRFCPCFDASGSNMGTNIQELPALSSSEIYYSIDAGATTAATTTVNTDATSLTTTPATTTPATTTSADLTTTASSNDGSCSQSCSFFDRMLRRCHPCPPASQPGANRPPRGTRGGAAGGPTLRGLLCSSFLLSLG